MMQKFLPLMLFSILTLAACQNTPAPEDSSDDAAKSDTVYLEKLWETDTLLTTAESVLYDEQRHVYYVSCIGAVPPWANDGDGFIARIDESGAILERQWVTGLNGPKGLGLHGNILYVNDNDRLVSIDVESRQILDRMPVAEAKNLNDVAVGADGAVYLSDSNTSTAYKVMGKEVTTLVQDSVIGGLNGIFLDGDQLFFAGFGSGHLFSFDPASRQLRKVADSMQGGDGIEKYGDGFFVSSWNGEIYHLDENWNRTSVLNTRDQEVNSADIEIVPAQQLLLVPTFFDNRVVAYRIHQE